MHKINKLIVNLLVFFIVIYQRYLSPILGRNCRFYPSCSQYASAVLQKYGAVTGIKKIILRILKCHPFCNGGIDLP